MRAFSETFNKALNAVLSIDVNDLPLESPELIGEEAYMETLEFDAAAQEFVGPEFREGCHVELSTVCGNTVMGCGVVKYTAWSSEMKSYVYAVQIYDGPTYYGVYAFRMRRIVREYKLHTVH